jgi:hypothetical protein
VASQSCPSSPAPLCPGRVSHDVVTVAGPFTAAPTGGGSYTYIAVRHTASGEYRIRVRLAPRSTTLQVTSLVSGTETVFAQTTVAGLVYNLGDVLRIKFNVSGSGTTALQAKVWKVGTSEPAAWQIDTTNSNAALQGRAHSDCSGTCPAAPAPLLRSPSSSIT